MPCDAPLAKEELGIGPYGIRFVAAPTPDRAVIRRQIIYAECKLRVDVL
jgi:hypothetical protein